ncbi:glycosyltransferase [Thalassovita sp.]|uniref:glycosyltransferase n=1 Tax=Thalassovita sp. TaxID=1979401 RepID=UPI0029DE5CA0|nr:glycosyltransferase [Thalassovita sp.]
MSTIAAVAIGRNEGERLRRCLTSLLGQVERVVYVDSGSTDGSVQLAHNMGVQVVELDTSVPFTAARARNAGFAALKPDLPDYVQFVDGDCGVQAGWLATAAQELDARPELGIVTGWRSEIYPERSIYNAIADFEWHRPAGEIAACGGDMMVRASRFNALGGFNPEVIAAEDDEFCTRLRKSGMVLWRLPQQMTLHDANMTRFSEWWRRAVRSGHGFAQVGALHPDHFVAERRRVWLFGAVLPLIILIGLAQGIWAVLFLGLGIYGLSYMRTVSGLQREGLPRQQAKRLSVLLSLSKFPNFLGMLTYYKRRLTGADMRIIEYK